MQETVNPPAGQGLTFVICRRKEMDDAETARVMRPSMGGAKVASLWAAYSLAAALNTRPHAPNPRSDR